MEKWIVLYESIYRRYIPYVIAIPLIVMTTVIFLNAIGRKLSIPFPITVELVEALLVVSVYFGVALVALEGGHVNVTFTTDFMTPKNKAMLDTICNSIAAIAFCYLAVSAWSIAWESIIIFEYRLAVMRFPLWPFKALFALGLTLMGMQLIINSIKSYMLYKGRSDYAAIS